MRARVKVEAIAPRPARHELNVPASAEADPAKIAKFPPPLPGRVVKLFVRLGEAVKQGAPLFTLDSADLVAAQNRLSQGALSRGANRSYRLRPTKGSGRARHRSQARPRTGGNRTRPGAQRTGTIEHATASARHGSRPGRQAAAGAGAGLGPYHRPRHDLGRIPERSGRGADDGRDLSTIWVTANVPEKDIQRVSIGDEASIDFSAYPGERLVGRVQFIGEVLVPETAA